MKKYFYILSSLLICISLNNLFAGEKSYKLLQKKDANFYEIQQALNEEFDSDNPSVRKGWKQFKRWEYFWEQRVFPYGSFPNSIDIYKETDLFSKKHSNNKIQSQNVWKSIGPDAPPNSESAREQGVGRVNIVRFNPTNELDLWIGAASGGLWRSTNGGNSWINYPYFNFLSLGVTDIAISPSNPSIIYVSTGDADGSIGSANNYYSIGVVKSTDGGATWNLTGLAKELSDKRILTRVLVDPSNPDVVIVGGSDGIRKTTDGGNTWTIKSSEWSIIDMDFKPNDSNVIYGGSYGYSGKNNIVKSTDMGETWKSVAGISGTFRLNIEVTPANPSSVYCLASSSSTSGFHSIQISLDEGQTWETTATVSSVGNILGWYDGQDTDTKGQGGYDLAFAVSPKDESLMYIGGVNIWKTNDMAFSVTLNTHWYGYYSKPYVHADIHELKFSPSGKRLYACNDGGISYTANGGTDWNDISKGLTITQFYRMSSSDLYPDVVMGGSQDNGTSIIQEGTWEHVYSADGMECLVDPKNPLRIFASIYYGSFYKSNNGGKNFSSSITKNTTSENAGWVTPFICNPQNSSTLLCGHQNVWINRAEGDKSKWKRLSNFGSSQVLQSLAVAPSDSNTIYAANYSELFVTYDGGVNWSSLYTTNTTAITYISVDPVNPKRIWITKSGYSQGDKVYEYDGSNWINLSGNLPNVPVNTIVYQKNSPDRVYIGTDIGVFYSDYSSGYWEKFGDGLPNVIVLELEINYSSKIMLRAASYGRGIWECEVLDCNLPEPTVNIIGDLEFCEGKSVTLELEGDYSNFVWSTGETSKSITIDKTGTYSVIITNTDGCKAKSKGIPVKVNPNKEISVSSSTGTFAFCGDQTSIELRASLGFDKYEWSNGDSTRKITITEPGQYYVVGTTSGGCVTKSEIFDIQRGEFPPKPSIIRNGNTLEAIDASEATKFQWYKDSKKIDGATSHTYSLLEDDNGKFTVEVFNGSGCSTISDEVDILVSVSENVGITNEIEIIPNPNNGHFKLSLNNINSDFIILEILDLNGKVVFSEKITGGISGSLNINASHLSNGGYILRVRADGDVYTKKWIKN